jgi:N-acetylglucosamine-6-phosphate deacetylase
MALAYRQPETVIVAARFFDGETIGGPVTIEILEGHVSKVHLGRVSMETVPSVHLPKTAMLVPGFIDLQVNGGGDTLLNDEPTATSVAAIAAAHLQLGTTTLLPTLITDEPDALLQLAAAADDALKVPGVAGFHLEGPFINPDRPGIHRKDFIRPLDEAGFALLQKFTGCGRILVTLAPECVGPDIVKRLSNIGFIVSIGHSDATSQETETAFDAGALAVTHLFNAMSQMTGRSPGVVGAVLASRSAFAGIICDGLHVAAESISAAWRALGPRRLFLVSDAMPTVGGMRPEFKLHGRMIRLADGRLTDDSGTLAGAHLSIAEAVRYVIRNCSIPVEDALAMATSTPANLLGLQGTIGCIREGSRADFCCLEEGVVTGVWKSGKQIR